MRQRHRWGAALVACVLALPAGGLRAEDTKPAAPMDTKAVDRQLYETLRDVINRGADIYNGGDWNGCYRLYEGALITVRPMLAHRPELQKVVDAGLVTARANPQMAQRAFDLRAAIDRIRDSVNPNPKPAPAAGLWQRLGGTDNVTKVIDDFVATAGNDPKVDFFRNGKYKPDVPTLKRQLVEFVSSVTGGPAAGGPLKYTGRPMKDIHQGMGITDAQFNAAAGHLVAALQKNKVKQADIDELVKIVETTRKDIVEKASGAPQKMTLWDRLGGEDKVKAIIHDFVAAAAKDDKVDFDRKKTTGKAVSFEVPKLEKLLVAFVSEATGGPLPYKGRGMKELHKGMGITEAQFDAAAMDLKKALVDNGVKSADVDAVLKAVNGYRKDIVEK